jgi:hypothetical protein
MQLLEAADIGSALWEMGVQENVTCVGSQQSHDSSGGLVQIKAMYRSSDSIF